MEKRGRVIPIVVKGQGHVKSRAGRPAEGRRRITAEVGPISTFAGVGKSLALSRARLLQIICSLPITVNRKETPSGQVGGLKILGHPPREIPKQRKPLPFARVLCLTKRGDIGEAAHREGPHNSSL